ncbi:hypothetical protein LINGRAHAP2_LOCUS1345 [Linum grandiflorum]
MIGITVITLVLFPCRHSISFFRMSYRLS